MRTLGVAGRVTILEADEIPGGWFQREFSWRANANGSPGIFSPVAWVATSKAINKNEEVTRSRDSRIRIKTNKEGQKKNEECGCAKPVDLGSN